MTATLTGTVEESSLRRLADRRLAALWWLAAVEDRMTTPVFPPGHLARLGPALAGRASPRTMLGRQLVTVPVAVRWADSLPVTGSDWYVNVAGAGDTSSYRLDPREVGGREPLPIIVDRTRHPAGSVVSINLSLGAPAASPGAPSVVSEPVRIRVP